MGIPLGGPVKSYRQPDIVIPMFDPSYTINTHASGNVLFKGAAGSLWPLINMQNVDSNGNLPYQDAYTPAPFGYGRTQINPGNSGLSLTQAPAGGAKLLWGNQLFLITNSKSAKNQRGWTVAPMAAGIGNLVSFAVPGAMRSHVDIDGLTSLGATFMIATQYLGPGGGGTLAFAAQFNSVAGSGDNNISAWDILSPGIERLLGFGWTGASQNNVNSAVPDLSAGGQNQHNTGLSGYITWILTTDNSSNIYVGPYVFDSLKGWTGLLSFDSAAVQAAFVGQANTFQSTTFGHLIINNASPVITGASNFMLLSKDGTKYALIKFAPQTAKAAAAAPYTNMAAHLDPTGVFYIIQASSPDAAKIVFNSYALDLPWLPVTVPTLDMPPFAIPGLCGCAPAVLANQT